MALWAHVEERGSARNQASLCAMDAVDRQTMANTRSECQRLGSISAGTRARGVAHLEATRIGRGDALARLVAPYMAAADGDRLTGYSPAAA